MRGVSWAIIAILIILGIWYFGFYNDKYEAPDEQNETGQIERSVEDLLNTDFEITREDNTDEYYFTPTSRFSLLRGDGEDDLNMTCDPEDAVGKIAGTSGDEYRFEAVKPGTCRIEIGDWITTVRVLEEAKG